MEALFTILALLSLLLLVVGVFSPNTSLFWYKQERTRGKSALIYIIAFLISVGLFSATQDKSKVAVDKTKDINASMGSTSDSNTSDKMEPKSNWAYSVDEDRMTNVKRNFASITSSNEIEFKFPYNGGSSFTLTIRNMGKENEVVLEVSKGQFITSIMSSEGMRIKFDDEQPKVFSYNSASDGSANIVFLNNANSFISRLKGAKKLMIEAEFFDSGYKIIEFNNVEGLIWDKK